MTNTNKSVTRITCEAKVFSAGKHRPIVVRIGPKDVIYFREQGGRRWYGMDIAQAYQQSILRVTNIKRHKFNALRKEQGLRPVKRIPLNVWNAL